jgi:hypothetical protein
MNAAQRIVEKFGGQSALSQLLGKGQSTVQYWCKSGAIPSKWQTRLLALATEQGIGLHAADFVAVPERANRQIGPLWAEYSGELPIGDAVLPVYVLNDGSRVISRTGATGMLAGKKGGGQLEKYASAGALPEYIPTEMFEKMIEFELPEVANKKVMGFESDLFLEICRGYVRALADGALKTASQIEMAHKASIFLAACSTVGLAALIDEATGYQYDRLEDALRVKLKAYLSPDMRGWEKTFPDELWHEFGRLTNWKGKVTSRPKYWGKLVTALIYEYLDPDVAKWLKENVPNPTHGKNWHQQFTKEYGYRKLMEHMWMVIGMAKVCKTMEQLRDKVAENKGKRRVTVTVYLPPKGRTLFDEIDDGENGAGNSEKSPEK